MMLAELDAKIENLTRKIDVGWREVVDRITKTKNNVEWCATWKSYEKHESEVTRRRDVNHN